VLWLGEKPLGRFWNIGPQHELYTPGPWLAAGENTITFFDLLSDSSDAIKTRAEPDFTGSTSTRN